MEKFLEFVANFVHAAGIGFLPAKFVLPSTLPCPNVWRGVKFTTTLFENLSLHAKPTRIRRFVTISEVLSKIFCIVFVYLKQLKIYFGFRKFPFFVSLTDLETLMFIYRLSQFWVPIVENICYTGEINISWRSGASLIGILDRFSWWMTSWCGAPKVFWFGHVWFGQWDLALKVGHVKV